MNINLNSSMKDIEEAVFKEKVQNQQHCPNCKKHIPMTKAFCSTTCKDDYFEYIMIQISPKFVKTVLLQEDTKEDRIEKIRSMAEYHGYNLELTKRKFNEIANSLGYNEKV